MTTTLTPALDMLPILRALPGGDRLPFSGWPPRAVNAIASTAIEVLAEQPGASMADAERLAHQVWARGRGVVVGANGEPVDFILSREPQCSGVVLEIATLMRVLLAAGDLHNTLLGQRRVLDAQIERLAQLRRKA